MPKKTKEQKIIAQYRKKIKFLETRSVETQAPTQVVNKNISPKTVKISTQEIEKQPVADDVSKISNFFINDFKKSIIFTCIIIALEIIFYFATINNYLKLM